MPMSSVNCVNLYNTIAQRRNQLAGQPGEAHADNYQASLPDGLNRPADSKVGPSRSKPEKLTPCCPYIPSLQYLAMEDHSYH